MEEGEVWYWMPDINTLPDPKPVLINGFRTEDGRMPLYIRDEEEAKREYWALIILNLIPLLPGRILSKNEFLELAARREIFEICRRNDPNDDGKQLALGECGAESASDFYEQCVLEGVEVRTVSLELSADQFAQAAREGRFINLRGVHFDGSERTIRGTIIGSSEGGGMGVPSIAACLFGLNQ